MTAGAARLGRGGRAALLVGLLTACGGGASGAGARPFVAPGAAGGAAPSSPSPVASAAAPITPEETAGPASATTAAGGNPAAAHAPTVAAGPPTAGSDAPPVASTPPRTPGAPRPTGKLRVFNIGMHIGGGPNDDETKAPIAKSVAPHFGALGPCFDQLPTKKETDVGVDLLVPAEGGKGKVSHPRSTTPGSDAFLACVVRVFEGIEFQRPRGGRTVVSYSLRFAP